MLQYLTSVSGQNSPNNGRENFVPVTVNTKPCIWTRNSVLIRLADSDSFSLREEQRESTSSIKMMLGLWSRANSNRLRTSLARNDNMHCNRCTCAKLQLHSYTEYLINAHSKICHIMVYYIYTVIKNTTPLLHSHVTPTNLAKYKQFLV